MKSKKIMLILITAIFLASIAGVCAADANDTLVASEDTNQIELSDSNKIIEDNLQTSEENDELTLTDNDVLGADSATYSDLDSEIRASGNVTLTHKNYIYDDGATAITITEDNKVIDGNGAIIDMTGSTIRAFTVSASGVTIKNLTIKNANYNGDGGAIYFSSSGTVTNCNFTDNTATQRGGAIYFSSSGTTYEVRNCNFTNNTSTYEGGAVYFSRNGNVTNCNFAGNNATGDGGAVYFYSPGKVTNCTFSGNTARNGGAIYFSDSGTTHEVRNCNFTDNKAAGDGGAIWMSMGSVENCNFTDDQATGIGGAIYFWTDCTVKNCNFTDNEAYFGGAIYFASTGNAANCNFTNNTAGSTGGAIYMGSGTVTNCNFTGNNATTGSAIYSYSTSSTKTVSNSRFLNNRANAEALEITKNDNNITITFTGRNNLLNAIYSNGEVSFTNVTYWSADGIANTDSSTPSRSNREAGQNMTIVGVVNGNIINTINATDADGKIVLKDVVGDYWIIVSHKGDSYYTEVAETLFTNMKFYANVTPVTTNNKTVNITAKSNIFSEVMPGKLLFILPNCTQINANYAGNGTWWAVHTFDDYAVYQVNASYDGLNNVTVSNAKITINKVDSTITLDNITLNYGESRNVAVATQGAVGITADINGINVTVINNYTIQIADLAAGNYTLTVTTIPDGDHNPVTRNATVTVNRAKTELTADAIITTYSVSKDLVITLKDSNDRPLSGLNITVDFNGTKNYTYLNSSNTTTVSIYKESSRVDTKPLTTDYNVHKYLVVGLKDKEGNPIRNADAYIEIHGVTYKCRSDDVGNARLIIRLNPGTYTAKITFDNVNYTGFTQYVTVIVKKLTPKLTAKKKTFKKSKKVKKYTVTLKANNKALAKVKLTLKVKGKTYKAKTNSKGKAVFKIKNLKKKGKYRATVRFAGNTYYNKVTKKVKITVK